jgi:hypothetical protein
MKFVLIRDIFAELNLSIPFQSFTNVRISDVKKKVNIYSKANYTPSCIHFIFDKKVVDNDELLENMVSWRADRDLIDELLLFYLNFVSRFQ